MNQAGDLILDRFLVVSRLGKGGFSSVYLARDIKQSDLLVALKVISLSALRKDQAGQLTSYFFREAAVLRDLDHPGLPAVYDFISTPELLLLVLEWIPGTNLQQYLKERSVDTREILDWATQITGVLDYLHSRQPSPILLGDLKPSNLILTFHGKVKVIDFGVAQPLQDAQASGQRLALVSPGYSPPEQLRARTTQQSDLFSFGATLLWCLTGQNANAAKSGLDKVKERLGLKGNQVISLISDCLELAPENRPASIRQVGTRLRQSIEGWDSHRSTESEIVSNLYRNKKNRVI